MGGLPPLAVGLGALATAVSAVNIVGGFRVSSKMLGLFRRPSDPDTNYGLYAAPVAVAVGGVALAALGPLAAAEAPAVASAGAAVACIAGIGGLATQQGAALGNVLGMGGVALGLGATLVITRCSVSVK
jgi:NAD(P) transhydrogenase